MNSIYKLKLDLNRSGMNEVVRAKLHDTMRELHMYLNAGSEAYHISGGVRAALSAKKPDGNVIFNACEVAGDKVIYQFRGQETAVPGVVECELRIYDGDKVISSARFEILVDETAVNDDEVMSLPEATELTRLMQQADEAIEKLREHPPVSYEPQTLTISQQHQARKNIGARGEREVQESINNAIAATVWNIPQELTEEKKRAARQNIGAADAEDVGREIEQIENGYVGTHAQTFSASEKTQARGNIDAVSAEDFEGYKDWVDANVVKFGGEQDLTEDEKRVARENINAVSPERVVELVPMDATLAHSGQAADAKAVGDRLSDTDGRISAITGGETVEDVTGTVVPGLVDTRDGSLPTGGSFGRTGFIPIDPNKAYTYTGKINYWAGVAAYADATVGSYVGAVLRLSDNVKAVYENEPLTIPPNANYIVACSDTYSDNPPHIMEISRGRGRLDNAENEIEKIRADLSSLSGNAVITIKQELTDAQQEQARKNIGAVSSQEVVELVPVDATLEHSGQAADAKAVGDRLGDTEDRISAITGSETFEDVTGEVVSGFVNATTGRLGSGGSYGRTGFIPVNHNKAYTYTGKINNWAGVAAYADANEASFAGEVLSRASTGDKGFYEDEPLTIPSNANYIIACSESYYDYPPSIKEISRDGGRLDDLEGRLDEVEKQASDFMPIYEHFSAFLNFTAIGDSLTFGLSPKTYNQYGYPATWGGNNNCSWVRRLSILTGANAINLGYSGSTAKTWCLPANQGGKNGLNIMLNGKRTQAYIIGLGANDVISDTYPIGTLDDVDFDNKENNADSFIGWYARILQSIMAFNPTAKIFVLNNPKERDGDKPKYQMLNLLCNDSHFKGTVYFVSFEEWKKYYEADCVQKWREGVHYSPPAYHHIARIMLSALSKRMCDDFKEFELIYDIPYDE